MNDFEKKIKFELSDEEYCAKFVFKQTIPEEIPDRLKEKYEIVKKITSETQAIDFNEPTLSSKRSVKKSVRG